MIRLFGLAMAAGLLVAASSARADDRAAARAFQRSMASMMAAMDVQPTGRADADFVRMMVPHHQGAIDMAKVERRYGRDPALRTMARDIIAAQTREIAEMKAWQARHAR